MKSRERKASGHRPFEEDAAENDGYLYTRAHRLSSKLATERSASLMISTGAMKGKRVLDAGCGDGHYTLQYWDRGGAREMAAIDAAPTAVSVATKNAQSRPIRFVVGDVARLPFPSDSFDVVLLQSVLHHSHEPEEMIAEAFRVSSEVVIHEPNGRNPGLKIFERLSRYHLEHAEKSYTARRIKEWVERAGGRVTSQRLGGFVPMFAPDWIAIAMKRIEPIVERVPILREFGSAVLVIVASRGKTGELLLGERSEGARSSSKG